MCKTIVITKGLGPIGQSGSGLEWLWFHWFVLHRKKTSGPDGPGDTGLRCGMECLQVGQVWCRYVQIWFNAIQYDGTLHLHLVNMERCACAGGLTPAAGNWLRISWEVAPRLQGRILNFSAEKNGFGSKVCVPFCPQIEVFYIHSVKMCEESWTKRKCARFEVFWNWTSALKRVQHHTRSATLCPFKEGQSPAAGMAWWKILFCLDDFPIEMPMFGGFPSHVWWPDIRICMYI